MEKKKFTTYSFEDTKAVINHPSVGQCVLTDDGAGKITIAYSGDMSSHTNTVNGYVIINKMAVKNGTVTIEVPQNSDNDLYLCRLCKYLMNAPAKQFALGVLTLTDYNTGKTTTCTGVTPQKIPDDTRDQNVTMKSYAFLAAEITEN